MAFTSNPCNSKGTEYEPRNVVLSYRLGNLEVEMEGYFTPLRHRSLLTDGMYARHVDTQFEKLDVEGPG